MQTAISQKIEFPYLLIANPIQLCYPRSKQSVSKVLCGIYHIQKFSKTLAKNPKNKNSRSKTERNSGQTPAIGRNIFDCRIKKCDFSSRNSTGIR